MNGIFEKRDYFQLQCLTVVGFRGYLPMFHPHGELVYVTEGSLPITVDGQSHTLQKGETALLFPYLTHSYENAPNCRAIIALFDPRATVFDNTLLSKKPIRFYAQGNAFQPILERTVTLSQAGKIKTAMSYLNAMIGELLEILPLEDRDGTREDITVQVLSWCAEHYTEDICVKSIADALYISQSYVSKVFAQKLKYSFREYISVLRVHKAQSLLETTDLRIGQIMAQCGFKNQSSFNRVFLDCCGVSPRAYRHTLRQTASR